MSYLNRDNVFTVASSIYKEVKGRYGLDVEGKYLEDIQTVMSKLWEKNKGKQVKSGSKALHNALNKKAIELVLPQVFRNIEAGYLNKTQNNLYVRQESDYMKAQNGYQVPQMSDNNEDAMEKFERLKREREQEGSYSAPLGKQENVYSSNNYQDKPQTYENQLPMTGEVKREIEPDAGATRFVNGEAVMQNSRQEIVRDVGPTNAPNFFAPPPDQYSGENTGPSLESFFKNAANLRGEDTTIQHENEDVDEKFAKLKSQYMQDGKIEKPRDASNRVEDVIGRKIQNTAQYNTSRPREWEETEKKMEEHLNKMANDKTTMETFFVNEKVNKIVGDNRKREQQELILNNQLSQNAYINYALVPPEKINYQTRKYYVTVDSLQRDFEAYPLPTNFQVRFEQPAQELQVPSYLNSDGVVIYGPPVVYQNVGGNGAKLENIYENIVELKCTDAQIPLDRIAVGGLAAYDFNGPQIDENKETPNAFSSFPYGPIWKENYGISIDVLDEPYYYLIVDEIDGAYDGTNLASRRALAKLNFDKLYGITRRFVGLKTSAFEGKTFYPSTWAKLSQMTLQLVTRFNQLLDVGVDKVFIKSIEQGEEVKEGFYCPLKPGQHLTKIKIVSKDPSYGQDICGVGLIPGDRLIFYSVFSCNPLAYATKLNDGIYINFGRYPMIYFYMVYDVNGEIRERKIDVRPFLKVGDMIIINNKFILDIEAIDTNGINLKVNSRMPFDPKVTVVSKGFVNVKKSGNNEISPNSFLAPNGLRVGGRLNDPNEFQLLYPFEDVPSYLKSPPYGFYRSKEAFYIHAKKQISYTFEITQVEQNMEKIDSRIIPTGG